MFERFSERARQVVVLAQAEAHGLKHNYIGTEHILLGLLREGEGLGARVLDSLGIRLDEVRAQVARVVGPGDEAVHGQIPFTPRAKRVLELSLREALSLGHSYIGTEHVLLGLVRENEGVAARVLLDYDADADRVREATFAQLGAPPPPGYDVSMEFPNLESQSSTFRKAEGFGGARRWIAVASALPMIVGALLFACGLLIGWLIWG